MGYEIKGLRNTALSFNRNNKLNNLKAGTLKQSAEINKSSNIENSLIQASLKVDKKLTPKTSNGEIKKTLSEKIESGFKNGIEYLKGVRDQAQADRKEGVDTLTGANKLWESLVSKAEEIGQKAQDAVLDDFAEEASKVVTNQLKDTKVGSLLEEVLGTSSSIAATSSGASAATTTTGKAVAEAGAKNIGASSTTSAVSGTLSKVVGGVGAAYSLYSLFNDFGKSSPMVSGMHGATVGAYVGSIVPGIGTVLGGVVGFAAGALIGLFNSGKHTETIARDNMRSGLKDYGFLDKDYNVALADGTKYSFATESKNKLKSLDGTERNGYQIDFGNKLSSQAIGWLQPLAEVMTAGNKKLKTDLLGYMVNAATSNANTEEELRANVASIYQQSKLDPEMVLNGLSELVKQGNMGEENIPAYVNGLQTLVTLPDQYSKESEEPIAA